MWKSAGVTSLGVRDDKAEVGGYGEVVGFWSLCLHCLWSWMSQPPLWMLMKKNTGRSLIIQKSWIKFDYHSWRWKDIWRNPQSHCHLPWWTPWFCRYVCMCVGKCIKPIWNFMWPWACHSLSMYHDWGVFWILLYVGGNRAEHKSWPTGFPHFYSLIYKMDSIQ